MKYGTEVTSWKAIVPNKQIIFDADAIISILSFGQEYIFDDLKNLGANFAYSHPVLLELMNTNSPSEKLRRSKLLNDHGFLELPLGQTERNLASQIQKSLPLKSTPSPTDLYLGSIVAAGHNNEDRFLLTANLKDFPLPIYTRKGCMLLQNETNVKVLSFLCVDKSQLVYDLKVRVKDLSSISG